MPFLKVRVATVTLLFVTLPNNKLLLQGSIQILADEKSVQHFHGNVTRGNCRIQCLTLQVELKFNEATVAEMQI